MPNTLAHLGFNGLMTRLLIKKADLLLIYIGSILPDLPWIIQRIVTFIQPDVNLYDLRLYSIVQASLFFCLVISAAAASLFKNFNRSFLILSVGSILHLCLDLTETKWGNGVHLLSPFSWELINLQLYWPEEIAIYILTGVGIIYMAFHWRETITFTPQLSPFNIKNFTIFTAAVIIYFLLPFTLVSNSEAADNHFVHTLRNYDERTGKYFEVDRGFFQDNHNNDFFVTPFKEEIKVANLNLNESRTMSVKAKFVSNEEIEIIEYHLHNNRDIYSYAGLFLILILLMVSSIHSKRKREQ